MQERESLLADINISMKYDWEISEKQPWWWQWM